jgi:multidrug efflux pump subunit AcrB
LNAGRDGCGPARLIEAVQFHLLRALLLTDDTLNMMSMIGIIMLMGLVTKNAILLVDNANERRGVGDGS